ncbi:uncharacterized protein LOC141718709 [Apium graveolens]|uniref:uncharacterized protein LOC141718709 n=1 Tax=Apium graveolens TaxID=4045 RepID=UPI003D79AEAC
MGPPANQGGEKIDEQWTSIHTTIQNTVAEEFSAAIKGAVAAMEQSLSDRFIRSFEDIFKRHELQLDEATSRLEGRINRSREHQESMINMIEEDQLKLQSDVRTALCDLVLQNKAFTKQPKVNPNLNSLSSLGKSEVLMTGEESNMSGRMGKGGLFGEGGFGGKGSGGGPGRGAQWEGGGTNWRHKKLDLPVFDGSNPDGWILRAERYFNFYRLTEEEKVEATVVALEGHALLWFQWEHRRRSIERWTLQEQWLSHTREGSVADYQLKFIELVAPLENIPEELALGQFLIGLRNDIRAEVRFQGPISVDQAMELAIMVEDKLRVSSGKKRDIKGGIGSTRTYSYGGTSVSSPKSMYGAYSSPTKTFSTYFPSNTSTANTQFPVAKPVGEIRRLSEKELQYKWEKGLCFKYDDKWVIGHKCRRKELSVLLTQGEDDNESEPSLDSPKSEGTRELVSEEIRPEISLNSVIGITSPKTMKLKGTIDNKQVVVMIEPGATHNFVSLDAVKALGLTITSSKNFGVALGTEESVQGKGECRSVVLQLQGITIIENFLPLSLGISDLILGIQWLEKLGTISTNWKTQTMKFLLGGETVTIKGNPSLGRTEISLKAMVRHLKKEKGGLPPSRTHEHSIVLKEGSDPVNVRPYHYPQVQKDEIENLIRDMLMAGIIRVSNSPFSSPVLLVKKRTAHGGFAWTTGRLISPSEKDHVEHARIILDILENNVLYANGTKCEFGKSQIAYLGHIISHEGVAVDQDKVKAMRDWPIPGSLKELRSFLGLTGYYQKFVRGYANIAFPLTEQLKKDNFNWTTTATQAFENLKAAMVTTLVLAMPNFKIPFTIEADASGYGLEAVLM